MKTRQDPERMKSLLARRERHGWNWSALSRRSGLPVWKLRWWQKRFARTDPPGVPVPAFVPIQLVPSRPPTEAAFDVTTPSGFHIRIPAGFAADELGRLVKALETQC